MAQISCCSMRQLSSFRLLPHQASHCGLHSGGSIFPVSLVACLVTHSMILPTAFPEFFSSLSAVTNVMDVFTIVIGLAGTISALLLRHSAAYRTNTIHRAPILPLSPTHLEFHPLLETAPVRIPWDRGPSL